MPANRRRAGAKDPALHAAVERDWRNDYADFSLRLKRELEKITDPAARRHAIRDMRQVLTIHQQGDDARSIQRHKRHA